MQIDAQFLENPYPSYKLLREQAPILWKEDFLGGAWIFSLYEDVAAILKDNRFSADRSYIYTAQFGSENQEKLAYFEDIYSKWMLLLDAPKHTRLRRLMNAGFKPKLTETMRGSILTIGHDHNDLLAAILRIKPAHGCANGIPDECART